MFFILLLLTVSQVFARYYCGLDPYTNTAMEFHILHDCKPLTANHGKCCIDHGQCYAKRTKVEECDNDYCACLLKIESTGLCKFHADNFCNHVKAWGHNFYPIFTDPKWGIN
ncbi:unnamed protein product [Auanema sp. JU1783]|nr:unnamed protein product [Auanema sp. JU1783]